MAALVLIHGVVAPLSLPLRAAAFQPVAASVNRIDASIPKDAAVEEKTVVVVNAPLTVMLSYIQVQRAALGEPRPAQLLWLASSSSELSVQKIGPSQLRLELAQGFLRRAEETFYRADGLGGVDRVSIRGARFDVVKRTEDGRPKVVDVTFDEPLDSPRYLLRAYRDGRLKPWRPRAAGEIERFEPHDFFQLLLEEELR
jgi:hypothetical protein